MMKRLFNCFILGIIVLTLSGCSLAVNDEYYNKDINDPKEYFIPTGVEFRMYKGEFNEVEIDVSEYFYVSFACEGHSIFDNCSSTNIGKSIDSTGTNIFFENSTINGVEQPEIVTTTIDLTFYALEQNDLSLYSEFIFENVSGDLRRNNRMGVDFATGIKLFGEVEGKTEDGTTHKLNYTFNFVAIDKLELVTVREFDKDDNLIEETQITNEYLLDKITLNELTEYYFIIEDYRDSLGNEYQERIYNDLANDTYYLYKYTNEYGFLNGERLHISKDN